MSARIWESVVKSQRAEENRAYVRGPLWQRQRAFAAALALAEQCALCSICQCARPDQDDGGNDDISWKVTAGDAALGRYSNIWMGFAENVTKLSAGTSAKLILSCQPLRGMLGEVKSNEVGARADA